MKKWLLLSSLLFSGIILLAQPGTRTLLSGYITDARTGQPLPGASVIVSDTKNGTTTDTAGHYQLRNIPSGHTIIEISYAGYKTIVEHIDISSNQEMNFSLVPSVLENEGVTITAVANATSIRKAPIPVTMVSKKDLINTTSSNIIDALSRQPVSVNFHQDPRCQNQL
jgi:iron complex outermembrane recepter protein